MENFNELMHEFKIQLNKGKIQEAYRYIFDIFADLGKVLKNIEDKTISINSLYHGYLDMTYLPIITNKLKDNGLKIAIVFNYSPFQFEIWLSAINRKKRKEILEIITNSNWKKYKIVENDENTDAIIELKIQGIDEYTHKSEIVSLISKETVVFINELETFIQNNEQLNREIIVSQSLTEPTKTTTKNSGT